MDSLEVPRFKFGLAWDTHQMGDAYTVARDRTITCRETASPICRIVCMNLQGHLEMNRKAGLYTGNSDPEVAGNVEALEAGLIRVVSPRRWAQGLAGKGTVEIRWMIDGDDLEPEFVRARRVLHVRRPFLRSWQYTRAWTSTNPKLLEEFELLRGLPNYTLFASLDASMWNLGQRPPTHWQWAWMGGPEDPEWLQPPAEIASRFFACPKQIETSGIAACVDRRKGRKSCEFCLPKTEAALDGSLWQRKRDTLRGPMFSLHGQAWKQASPTKIHLFQRVARGECR